jgi:hypothetical protein
LTILPPLLFSSLASELPPLLLSSLGIGVEKVVVIVIIVVGDVAAESVVDVGFVEILAVELGSAVKVDDDSS